MTEDKGWESNTSLEQLDGLFEMSLKVAYNYYASLERLFEQEMCPGVQLTSEDVLKITDEAQ